MKQLSNKIIFVFLLAVGLSLVPAYKASAIDKLVYFTEVDGGGGGGGGGGNNPPPVNTPPIAPTPIINLNYRLDKENGIYSPGEDMVVTIGASNIQCENAVSGIEISGYINSRGSSTSKPIIINTSIQGNHSLENSRIYKAPDSPGGDVFIGTLSVYKAINSYVKKEYTDYNGIDHTDIIVNGESIVLDGTTYIFKGDHFVYPYSSSPVPIDYLFHNIGPNGERYLDYSESGISYHFTFYPVKILNELAAAPYVFSIPFTVVAPTPKSMTIDVYKNGVKVQQGADKVISQAVQSGTELLIRYTPSGLSFPFTCDEPVSREYSNGYTRTFTKELDITSFDTNPGFYVVPSKTTNYSVTCSN